MFGSLGGGELLFILVLALIFLGPRRLPEVGRILGKAVGEFRKATAEFRRGVEKEIDLTPVREATQQLARARQELTELARTPARALARELEQERSEGAETRAATRQEGGAADPSSAAGAEPSVPRLSDQNN